MFRFAPRTISKRAFTSSQYRSKIIPEAIQTTPGKRPEPAMDAGADAAKPHAELSDGIHESAKQATSAGEKSGTPAFSKDGAIGSMFKSDGAVGGTAEKVGGPFASDGAIGKNFTEKGAVGGTIQENLGKKE